METLSTEQQSRISALAGELTENMHRVTLTPEGYSAIGQMAFIAAFCNQNKLVNVAEIGFNAGHSAASFLVGGAQSVTSFDIGSHDYVQTAKSIIDSHFPQKHALILGDSKATVPQFSGVNHFDCMLIDGAHSLGRAQSDIRNSIKLLQPESFVIIDDIVPTKRYGFGPSLALTSALGSGMLKLQGFIELKTEESAATYETKPTMSVRKRMAVCKV